MIARDERLRMRISLFSAFGDPIRPPIATLNPFVYNLRMRFQ